MARIVRFFICSSLVALGAIALPAQAAVFCNPVVDPLGSDTTLVRTLSRVAEEYEFELSLPESLDHPIRFKKSMTLERLVKQLTRDLNTVLKHKKVDGCATPVLTHLVVLQVGQETEHVSKQLPAQELPVEYIYIDDMETYVTNVLLGNQQAEPERMTPEQREEYRIVRESHITKPDEEASQTEKKGSDL